MHCTVTMFESIGWDVEQEQGGTVCRRKGTVTGPNGAAICRRHASAREDELRERHREILWLLARADVVTDFPGWSYVAKMLPKRP